MRRFMNCHTLALEEKSSRLQLGIGSTGMPATMRPFFWALIATLLLFLGIEPMAGADLVSANVLKRVKRIVVGQSSGTAFTIEVDGLQYILTAKHVVAGLQGNKGKIEIYEDKDNKKEITVDILRCDDPIDIAVLVPPAQVTVNFPLPPEMKGAFVSQEMFFVGFPFGDFGLTTHDGQSAIGFVRKAIFSAQVGKGDATILYLDGTNNPGFSGGPVVYKDLNIPNGEMKVAGVISGFRNDIEEVMKGDKIEREAITQDDLNRRVIRRLADGSFIKLSPTGNYVVTNTGVVIAYPIERAVELIKRSGIKGPQAQ
ncbi:serine protease [Bradyrhizobium sediminis]|uniref:Serine protease n=1 Tax=Bradyrhizobium sediminis TaxID=2840469 RepID=A0A975RXZ5_9BRAD|nr:serine protease [Bradyrhizobium sediminis]QWG24747.1 serine protease [Bradyrhizobium sediminis]